LGRDAREPSSAEQLRLSVAFHGLFTAFAREAPVLLVVEDLHWADEASLGLLHYLARELRDTRIALLASYRSDEMHRRHPLLRAIAAMQRERLISEIALARLSREKVGELVRAVFIRTDPNINVSDEFRDAIYARSEGNPFFTEELLKALVESGDLVYAADRGWNRTKPIEQLSIPGSVREAVRARTEKLSPDAQQTLSAASVIGLRFRFELLRAIRGAGETELEAHLREFIEQQLAVELGGPADEYGFRHALTREVVYDDLLVRERKRLHRSVAEALSREESSEPALLAHHLVAAGETAAAVPHLLEAAARAQRAFAPREAVVHYERALEIGVPDEQVAGILERVAEACYLFDFARSRKAAEEAAGEFRARGDRHGLSRMLRLASRDAWQQADASRARTLAQEAIQALDGLDDSVELGRAVANLAGLRMIARADEEAIAVAERALALGERFADAWTVANALITKGSALNNVGRTDEGRAILRRGLDLAIAEGLAEVAVRAYNNLMIRADLHVDERRRLVDEGLEYGRRHGLEQPMLTTAKCFIALGRGDWDEALAIGERVAEGSFWFDDVIQVRNIIVLGRSGPEAALAQAEQRAAGRAEQPEAQAMVAPLAWAATVRVLTGDTAAASRWLALIERRAAEDPGVARMLVAGTTPVLWFVSLVAAACDAPGWRERIEAALPADPSARLTTEAALDCADGLATGDPDRTARALAELQTRNAYRGWGGMPDLVILAGRDALRRGLRLGPAWLAIIETARAYSQRAEAGWLLSELDRLQAEVATS
ncbi:MAG TPA: hypothetical protein VMJ92_05750, partial [Candidatus Limnocylindrales bacterium]|nr:hypothetical protein [Candidatus Limnocylindrales bacterium]